VPLGGATSLAFFRKTRGLVTGSSLRIVDIEAFVGENGINLEVELFGDAMLACQ
jgi:hypothetical protein